MEIQEFVKRMKEGSMQEEYDIVIFIMRNLINPTQTLWFTEQQLTISDLLNGRFNGDQEPTVEAIFADWNLKCGDRIFSLGPGGQ